MNPYDPEWTAGLAHGYRPDHVHLNATDCDAPSDYLPMIVTDVGMLVDADGLKTRPYAIRMTTTAS